MFSVTTVSETAYRPGELYVTFIGFLAGSRQLALPEPASRTSLGFTVAVYSAATDRPASDGHTLCWPRRERRRGEEASDKGLSRAIKELELLDDPAVRGPLVAEIDR